MAKDRLLWGPGLGGALNWRGGRIDLGWGSVIVYEGQQIQPFIWIVNHFQINIFSDCGLFFGVEGPLVTQLWQFFVHLALLEKKNTVAKAQASNSYTDQDVTILQWLVLYFMQVSQLLILCWVSKENDLNKYLTLFRLENISMTIQKTLTFVEDRSWWWTDVPVPSPLSSPNPLPLSLTTTLSCPPTSQFRI